MENVTNTPSSCVRTTSYNDHPNHGKDVKTSLIQTIEKSVTTAQSALSEITFTDEQLTKMNKETLDSVKKIEDPLLSPKLETL
jgi:hypothetical protein